MPIRPEHRYFYPIDWPELSAVVRFRRAGGRCEACKRPHLQRVHHLGDGRWWDADAGSWRDGTGRRLRGRLMTEDLLGRVRTTRVMLATAIRNHDTYDLRTPSSWRSASAASCRMTGTNISSGAGSLVQM